MTLSATNAANLIIGMNVVSNGKIIGKVIKTIYEENELSGVEILKNSDSSVISVHRNRIENVDTQKSELVIN